MDGNDVAHFVEASDISLVDAAKQEWIPQGPIVEASGEQTKCRTTRPPAVASSTDVSSGHAL